LTEACYVYLVQTAGVTVCTVYSYNDPVHFSSSTV